MGFLGKIGRALTASRAAGGGKARTVVALVLVASVLGPAIPTHADESEKSVLGGLLSKALSTPGSQVAIGAVDGALSSDATIRDVAISDANGVWLKLDKARLVWRRLALLSGRLEIDSLEVGRLEVLRRPLPAPVSAKAEPDGSLLPDLPVKVEVKAFRLAELVLGEPLAGQPARLTADGKARLGAPSEGLDVDLKVHRLDAAGDFTARLLFVPKGETLELKTTLVEPVGGLLSKAANLPGTPAIDLDLDGRGTLDAWNARLNFDAGPDLGAKGSARISRIGTDRRLILDLASRIEGLLPGPAAAVFSGTTKLEGALRFSDSGAFGIDRLDLTSRTARLETRGTLTADRVADFTVAARAVPTEGGITKAADAELDSLVFDGSLRGPIARPAVNGVLRAAGLRADGNRLDRVDANLAMLPAGSDPQSGRFALTADAKVEGLTLADPALRRAIGSRAALTLRGTLQPTGLVEVARFEVEGPTARATYAGTLGQNTLAGTVEAALSDLAAFSDLAGRPLAGSLTATAKLGGDPARKAVTADVDARADGLALSMPALDGLLGRAPRFTGRLAQVYDGYTFDGARLEGAEMTARLDGRATARLADAKLVVDLKDLSAVDETLSGRALLDGRLTGSLEKPDLTATVTGDDLRAQGRPIRTLRLETALRDLTGALDGTVRLTGDVAGKALRADAHLARAARDWALDRLAFSLGSVAVTGNARAGTESFLTEGSLTVSAANLDDLSPLVLRPLGGSLEAAVTLSRAGGRQDAAIRAKGASLRAGAIGLARLDADLTGRDLLARPVVDGRVNADRLTVSGETLDTVRLVAVGTPSASDITLTAKARGFDLDGAARLVPADRTRIELARFSAARGGDRLALAGPATITLADGGALIDNLVIAAGAGRVALSGRAGPRLDLKLALRAVPLALVRIASPGLALTGTLDGEADLRGTTERPDGHYALTVARLVTPETRKAGLPPIDAKASGTLSEGRAGIEGRVSAGRGAEMTVSGSVPVAAGGTIALKLRGTLEAALANSLLSVGGQRVAGRIALDAGVTGTLAAPRAEGAATLTGGSFTDPLQGIRLTNVEGRVTGRGDTLVVERLTALTRNGGTLRADGRVALQPASGFPGSLRLTAERAELVSSPLMTAVASLNLALSGPLARTPKISGRVDLVSVDVTVPDRLPASVKPLDGVRHVNTPPEVRVRLAARADRKAAVAAAGRRRGKAAVPFDATLDVAVNAPNRIFVRGRGIDAELGGALRLTGSSRDPVATGEFEMRRGRLSVVGQRLDFTRGRLTFGGEIAQPDLDFLAETKAAEITARIAVTGPASQPAFTITSDPSLPQDEVLSRLLFKKASGGLSPFQALQLAQAVAQFSGGAGGVDVFEQARKGLGLDSLDISTGASGGPAVGASRYLSDKLSVGVKAGAKPADTAATVDYDVTRRIKIQGEAGSDGRTAVGVGAEWEY
ncbi:translocation/assembly module TamB domain-containing protein [Methylobacterium adhaesivum]|uniref:Translocation/assembly module TamB domain-containing protein n=1 Tax=Methylobacterium adhaesivum TaxID=333297 RepID=A0ABT8BGP7_9HYPH|nr:translocation/assembly module TamB domain-containing protein [Methylobacterium adhaesivum]MDN3591312.1 translocation/assembly module TamB domain-containing protein [Methylobacterium adhaesivum]